MTAERRHQLDQREPDATDTGTADPAQSVVAGPALADVSAERFFRIRAKLVKAFGLFSVVPELAAEAVETMIAEYDTLVFPGDSDTDVHGYTESW